MESLLVRSNPRIEHVGSLKAVRGSLKAVFDRGVLPIGRRKPKLYVHPLPLVSGWCVAKSGQKEMIRSLGRRVSHATIPRKRWS
jgi:hypothetical protein